MHPSILHAAVMYAVAAAIAFLVALLIKLLSLALGRPGGRRPAGEEGHGS